MEKWIVAFICLITLSGERSAQSETAFRHVDPSQLDVPWPKHSFYKQPWRGWLETTPAARLLDGIGINFNSRYNVAAAARLLGECGFRHARIEIGWGHILYDESGIEKNAAAQLAEKIRACRQNGIRPLILLNAHHGWPCPSKAWQAVVEEAAPEGARAIRLSAGTFRETPAPRYTSLFRLGTKNPSRQAEDVFLTEIDPATGACALSRPLPVALTAGQKVWVRRLKYQPFNEPETAEFAETAGGFVRYARIACDFVKAQGVAFDVELWNELTFGSDFLTIDRYYDPPIAPQGKGFLKPGGRVWEAARRAIEMVKKEFPGVRCLWGFSNTTFFHTKVADLPPNTDGQSYHPYGTGYREFPAQEDYRDRAGYNLEGFTPTYRAAMAEGFAANFIKTECLMRLLNPEARKAAPAGTATFMHYMTEHGFAPTDIRLDNAERAWRLKSKVLLRNLCFWMNKGLDRFYYYCSAQKDDLDMGLLPAALEQKDLPVAAEESGRFLTPPLLAARRVAELLQGATAIRNPRQLSVKVEPMGENRKVFDGDSTHPPLTHKDVFAFLPYQIDDHRFAIAVYVMTHDYTQDMPPEDYRLTIGGVKEGKTRVGYADPISGSSQDLSPNPSTEGLLSVTISAVDYPRFLVVSEE